MTQDTLEKISKKTVRQKKSLEEEIALQREKLKRLEDKHREQQRKWREKNQKSVLELIRSEKLDLVEIEKWQEIIPNLKTLLAAEST
jgi:hypothetical protein